MSKSIKLRNLNKLNSNYNVLTLKSSTEIRNVTGLLMKSKLVRIGNSKGVRIPKSMLQEAGLTEDVEILQRDHEILIRSLQKTRNGWAQAFEKMTASGDDVSPEFSELDTISEWDETEWTW